MSKAAVISLTRSLAQEVSHRGSVNTVAPGFTITPMTTRNIDGDDSRAGRAAPVDTAGKANPIRENVEPNDLAAAVLYLVADTSRHVTGQARCCT